MNDSINDIFLTVTDTLENDNKDNQMDSSRVTLLACLKCVEELAIICEDCEIEMSKRDPIVMSNCRDFMHRYATSLMSRITLELAGYLGQEALSRSVVNDMFIVESMKFTHTVDEIKHFQFLPRIFFQGLRENLKTSDQLFKFWTRLLLERNECWFTELNELQPRQRGRKLREFFKIVGFQVDKIHSCFYIRSPSDVDRKRHLITNTISTMIFNLAEYVGRLDFSHYGEEALLEHILACQEVVKFCFGLRVYPYHGKVQSDIMIEKYGFDPQRLKKQWVIALRDHELEEVSTTLLNSANLAAENAVSNTFQTFEDIRKMLFYEKKGTGWLAGRVCEVYLERVTTWMNGFCERASKNPCEFHRITIRETIRMVVYSYVKGLCDRYKYDKKFMLSEGGCRQLASDLQAISSWIDAQNVNLIPTSIKNKSVYKGCNDLTMLLRNIRMFSTSDVSSLLFCFSEAMQHFGTGSALQLYDLARLCLKIRSDVSNSDRKRVLSLYSVYVEQLQNYFFMFGPLSKSHPRLSGPELLKDLFPNVGTYHCSGKKWSLEKLSESEADARLEIADLVTDTCNVSRIRRAGVTNQATDTIATRKQSSFRTKRQSSGVDERALIESFPSQESIDPNDDTNTSELWKLLDPSYVMTQDNSTIADSDVGDNSCDFGDDNSIGCFDSEDNSDDYYNLPDDRPFVDLHGCTFEELHATLRPKIYSENEFDPVNFVVTTPGRKKTIHFQHNAFMEEDRDNESDDGGIDMSVLIQVENEKVSENDSSAQATTTCSGNDENVSVTDVVPESILNEVDACEEGNRHNNQNFGISETSNCIQKNDMDDGDEMRKSGSSDVTSDHNNDDDKNRSSDTRIKDKRVDENDYIVNSGDLADNSCGGDEEMNCQGTDDTANNTEGKLLDCESSRTDNDKGVIITADKIVPPPKPPKPRRYSIDKSNI